VETYTDSTRNPPAGRMAGIVLHPTSLDGPYGTGDLGAACRDFVDWLATAGMRAWQVLPLVPPDQDYSSPYSGQDALCGNPLLISLEGLVESGLLEKGASSASILQFDHLCAIPLNFVPSTSFSHFKRANQI
jgi:4-alpha-glucanotransferase